MSGMTPIRGELLKWAREQRGLTMRNVYDAGGPSVSYQCEVEKGRKRNVHGEKLSRWLRVLDVPEAFVRGNRQPYHEAPAETKGLAADIRDELLALQATPRWAAMRTQERLRTVLQRLTRARHLTTLVLAYVLGLDLDALDAMLTGTLDIPKDQVGAIADLTLLDPADLLEGVSDRQLIDAYGPVMRLAFLRGIPAEAFQRWLDELT